MSVSQGYSGTNLYIDTFDITGKLIVDYVRSDKWTVNQVCTITPVNKPSGLYLRVNPNGAVRSRSADGRETVWADKQDSPSGEGNDAEFEFFPFECRRHRETRRIGWVARDTADGIDIVDIETKQGMSKLMTSMYRDFMTVATTSGNYTISGHVQTATAWGGGLWTAGTINTPTIRPSLHGMALKIIRSSTAAVTMSDLNLLISPVAATAMAGSQEIRAYLAQSPSAMEQVMGGGKNSAWGLPNELYGINVIVQDREVYDTANKGETESIDFTWPQNTAVLSARPGGQENNNSSSNFSAFHVFQYKGDSKGGTSGDLQVETFDHPQHRRTDVCITRWWDIKLIAPRSAAMATNILS